VIWLVEGKFIEIIYKISFFVTNISKTMPAVDWNQQFTFFIFFSINWLIPFHDCWIILRDFDFVINWSQLFFIGESQKISPTNLNSFYPRMDSYAKWEQWIQRNLSFANSRIFQWKVPLNFINCPFKIPKTKKRDYPASQRCHWLEKWN
jgi:hypothetical protein